LPNSWHLPGGFGAGVAMVVESPLPGALESGLRLTSPQTKPFATNGGRLAANVTNGCSTDSKLDLNVRDDAALAADFVASVRSTAS
jgi:hypothetical protein